MSTTVAIPGYELVERLGTGSTGEVYKARQVSMDRLVAIKVLPGSFASDARFIERFYREARAVARLNHPNIVTGIDVGQANDVYYFVMEYVDGDSLSAELEREGAIEEPRALEIARQVACALDHAYKNGIVHRDIKPANILMTRSGTAKLADLGVAKHAGAEGGAPGAGRVFGTPYYMSPEQARAEIDIDIRSDIYSLGASLYHLLSGKPPFYGLPPAMVMAKQIAEDPEDVREINPEVSRAAAELVAHMMAKSPEDRPATPADLIEATRRVEKGLTAPRPRPPAATGTQSGIARRIAAERQRPRSAARNPVVIASVAGGLLLLAAGLSAVLLSSGPPAESFPPAPQAFVPSAPRVPASAPSVSPTEPKDAEQQAQEAFGNLRKRKLSPREELASIRELLKLYAGTAEATRAAKRAANLEAALKVAEANREMRAKVAELRAEAAQRAQKGDVAGALKMLDASNASDATHAALAAAAGQVRANAEMRIAQAESRSRDLTSRGEFAEARALLTSFDVRGIEDLEKRIAHGVAQIDKAEAEKRQKETQKLTHAAEGRYAKLCEKVDAALGDYDPDEAERLVAEATGQALLSPLLDRLAEDLVMISLFRDSVAAALEGASSLKGRTHAFRTRDGGVTNGVIRSVSNRAIEVETRLKGMGRGSMVMQLDVAKLAPAEISSLALRALDERDAKTHLKLAVLCAAQGDVETARRHLTTAQGLGADVSGLRRRWRAVLEPKASQKAGSAPAPAEKGAPAAQALPEKPSPELIAELKKIQARAAERYQFFMKEKRLWDIIQLYVRLEKFREALAVLTPLLSQRNPGPCNWDRQLMDRAGFFELEYARVLTYLGETRAADRLLAEHDRRVALARATPAVAGLVTQSVEAVLKASRDFITGYPAAKKQVDELAGKLADSPDAATQWKLIQLCDPHRAKAVLPIRWFTAVFELIARYPEDPQVKSGAATWVLQRAYNHHELYEEAALLLEGMAERCPENDLVKTGDHLYHAAHLWGQAGRLHETMRQKKAVEGYRNAVKVLQRFRTGFPENARNTSSRNDAGEVQPAATDTHIDQYNRMIDNVVRTLGR